VRRGEALVRRAEYKALVEHVFGEVMRVFGPALEYTSTAAGADHEGAIYDAHKDYDTIKDGVLSWIDQQART